MAIKQGKKRVMITLDIEVLEMIEEISKNNLRTVSNEIALLIKKEYELKKK